MTEQPDEDLLEQLVADALHLMQQGDTPDLDELCKDHPELKTAVADALALANEPAYQQQAKAPGSLAGEVFDGRYVLSECIGSGAMGAVYRADDLELGRTVALKFLRTEMLLGQENARRFEREGEVLARLNHVSIATIYDRKRDDDGQAYIVMEYVDGISLQHALDDRAALGKDGRMQVREAVQHAAQLARALELVHEKGIVHRDVKPSNIMLSSRGPVLIDFGIAALGNQETLAEGTRGVGTPAYMAPEQLRAGGDVGRSVDIYGLTASLYRALTGNAPYEGTPAEVLAAIPHRDPELPASLRPELPRDLLAILDVGLNRDLGKRYASMRQLREDLDAFLEHEPVKARYPGALGLFARRVRRSPAALAAIAVTLVFVAGLLGVWGYSEVERQREAAREASYADANTPMQPLLTLWNPKDRQLPMEERRRQRELLDRAVDNAQHPLPSLALRAAFRADHGDFGGAAADIGAIADQVPGPVASFLVGAYRTAAEAKASQPSLEGAPEPETWEGVYLLAYQELRKRNFKQARKWLGDARLDGFDPALEIRLVIQLEGLAGVPLSKRKQEAAKLREAVLRMEERYGRTTATTAHLEGMALLHQERYAEAYDVIEKGLDLAPESANLLENAGVALRRLASHDQAAEYLAKAIARRPHALGAYRTLFWVHLVRSRMGRDGALEQAEELLRSELLPNSTRRQLGGELAFEHALAHYFDAKPELARAAAEQALQRWQGTRYGDEFKKAVAACLSSMQSPFAVAAEHAANDLSNWSRLLLTYALMPPDLNKVDQVALRDLFYALLQDRTPNANYSSWSYSELPLKRK